MDLDLIRCFKPMKLGNHKFEMPLILAPMAGVSDMPFRSLCSQLGADYCVSEMITSRIELWKTQKTKQRLLAGDLSPKIIQIVGGDASLMAESASRACENGAEIVDINMGCPAKKVCRKAAGSALLADPLLVAKIINAVVRASDRPVTLKIRTGPNPGHRNGLLIAKIAESEGIAAVAIHGRSKDCRYDVPAEYETIAEVKASVRIPVLVNGDITCGQSALKALRETNADGLMIGRASQGNPWIFPLVRAALNGKNWKKPDMPERLEVLHSFLESLYEHYGFESGSRIARKHLIWFLGYQPQGGYLTRDIVKRLESSVKQLNFVRNLKQEIENKEYGK